MSFLTGGSKQSSTQTTTPVDLTPEAFQALRGPLADAFLGLFQTGGPVFTGSTDLGASTPTIANPLFASLRQQIADAQARLTAAQRPTTGAVAATPQVAIRGGAKQGEGGVLAPTTARPSTTGGSPAEQAQLQALLSSLQTRLAKTPQFTANPQFRAPTAQSVGAGTDPLVAQLTPDQLALIDRTVRLGLAPDPAIQAATRQVIDTLSGKNLSPESNPFLAAAIEAAQRPVREAFTDVAVPELLSRFTGQGQFVQGEGSSAFASEAGRTTRGLTRDLADISTRLSSENFQAERGRQIEAVSLATGLKRETLNNAISALQAASLPQLVKDLGVQRGLEQFNKRITTILEALRLATSAALPAIGQTSTGTSKGKTDGGLLPTIGSFINPVSVF